MKILLSALTSFSLAGGVTAPLIMNNSTTNQNVNVQNSKNIDLGQNVTLSTNQGSDSWSIEFDFEAPAIHTIQFNGGGLKAYADWGSDNWSWEWSEISTISNGETKEILRDKNTSGLAKQETLLTYTLTNTRTNHYKFELYYYTKSSNSFTDSTGTLNIGNQLNIIY